MKKTYLSLLALTLSLSLLTGSSLSAKSNDVTILFTHDLHDNYEPFKMEVNGKVEERGGFARLKTAIDLEKERDSDALLVDAGDYSQGTLFQSIYATHAPSLRLLGMMGFDATTYGNHEFDFRTEGLRDNLRNALDSGETLVEILDTNTNYDVEGKSEALKELKEAAEEYGTQDIKVVEKNGVKIGLFGLMGYEADSNAPTAEVEFVDMIEEAKRAVKLLQAENVEMIVLLSHAGTNPNKSKSEDEILASKVPEIDFIVSGHSHTLLEEPIIIGDTIIASTGWYGQNLGKAVLEKNESRWKLKEYTMIPINDSLREDEAVKAKIDEFKSIVNEDYLSGYNLEFNQVIANAPFGFTPSTEVTRVQGEEPIAHLIGDAYINAVKNIEKDDYKEVNVAVLPSGVLRDSITQGDITVSDAFKILPLGVGKDGISGYPLIDVYLTGEELRLAAEIDASISPIMTFARLYMTGMSYSFNPNRMILNKVTDAQFFDGQSKSPIENGELYRVVTDLYTAQMLSVVTDQSFGLLSIVPKNSLGETITNFEDNIIHDKEGNELKVWVALTEYLNSFDENDAGVSEIDSKYASLQGYKVIENEKGFFTFFKNPNKFSIAIYTIILVLLLLIILLIRFIVKFVKKRRNKL